MTQYVWLPVPTCPRQTTNLNGKKKGQKDKTSA